MRTVLALAALLVVSGCTRRAITTVGMGGSGRYAPQSREAAWGRALEQVQARGKTIAWCSYESGVIRVESTNEDFACAGAAYQSTCSSRSIVQLTIWNGLVTMSTHHVVTGIADWRVPILSDANREEILKWDAEMLASIVGG
jgi:hypothetical protein